MPDWPPGLVALPARADPARQPPFELEPERVAHELRLEGGRRLFVGPGFGRDHGDPLGGKRAAQHAFVVRIRLSR